MKKIFLAKVLVLVGFTIGGVAAQATSNSGSPDRFQKLDRLLHQKTKGPIQRESFGESKMPLSIGKNVPETFQMGSGMGSGPLGLSYSYLKLGTYVDSISVTPDDVVYGLFDGTVGRFGFGYTANGFQSATGGIDMSVNNAYQLLRTGIGSLVVVGESQFFGSPGWIEVFDESSMTFISSTPISGSVGDGQTPTTVAAFSNNTLVVGGFATSSTTFILTPWVRRYTPGLVFVKESSLMFEGAIVDMVTAPNGTIFACGWEEEGDNDNIWIGKFDSGLNLLKEKKIDTGGGEADIARALTIDSNGSVYVAGSIYEMAGGTNAWIGRFNQNLDLEASVSSIGAMDGTDDGYNDIIVAGNRVYVTGVQGSSFKILSENPRKAGDMDIVLASYTKDLTLTSNNIIFGNAGLNDAGFSLGQNGNGNMYVSGYVEDNTSTYVSGDTVYVQGINLGLITQHKISLSSPISGQKPQSFPNPFRPSQGHTAITIANIPPNQTVRLFSLKGELVRSIPINNGGEATWDLKNESGEIVQSGVYFGTVDGGGSDKTFKVVVQR